MDSKKVEKIWLAVFVKVVIWNGRVPTKNIEL